MFHFAQRPILLLIPVALLLLWILRRPAEGLSRARRALSFAVRSAVLVLLLIAAADPSRKESRSRPTLTVFVLDVSDSVGRQAHAEALQAVERAPVPPGGRTALIAFAGRAKVIVPVQEGALQVPRDLRTQAADLDLLDTRPGPALLAAEALYRGDSDNRTVLVTDGRCPMQAVDPRVRVIALPGERRQDLAVLAFHPPLAVRYGEPFNARVDLEGTVAGDASIELLIDDAPEPVRVEKFRLVRPGRVSLELKNLQGDRALEPGFHRLVLQASMAGDEELRNNNASASVMVVGRPRVLLVEGTPADGEALSQMLKAQAIDHARVEADRLGARLDTLASNAAVVLAGVSPGRLGAAEIAALRTYVENGGGLLFAGSERVLRDPGLDRPEFTSMLPVELIPAPVNGGTSPDPTPKPTPSGGPSQPKRVLVPTIGLCLLVDKSGSMAGDSLRLAKEACIAAAKTLGEKDSVCVIAFDIAPHLALEFVSADRSRYIEEKILRIAADGGTNIQNALTAAARAFQYDPRGASAGIKHCILLSDGKTQAGDFGPAIAELKAADIHVSTVCVGNSDNFDFPLMQAVARDCGGRARFTASFSDVPQLFVDETRKVILASEQKVESVPLPPATTPSPDPTPDPAPTPTTSPGRRTVIPLAKEEHEVLRGIDRSFPALEGLMQAKARPTSSAPLRTADDEPVLAIWRFGLGKSAAWLSDIGGPWSRPWSSWPSTPALFAQLLRHLSSASDDLDLSSRVRLAGRRIEIDPGEDSFEAHVIQPGRAVLPLERGPEGSLRSAPIAAAGGGTRIVAVSRTRGGRTETLPILVSPPFPHEIAPPSQAPSQLDRVDHRPLADLAEVFPPATMAAHGHAPVGPVFLLVALLLLPLDVAVRRIT